MTKKLNPGDCVRLIGHANSGGDSLEVEGLKAVIVRPFGNRLTVKLLRPKEFGDYECEVFPSQCRKLKPRAEAKQKRVERWITVYTGENQSSGYAWLSPGTCMEKAAQGKPRRTVRLIELRKGEAIVSREGLAKAWASIGFLDGAKNQFSVLCAALGLKDKQ